MVSQCVSLWNNITNNTRQQTLHLFVATLLISMALLAYSNSSSAQTNSAIEVDNGTIENARVNGSQRIQVDVNPRSSGWHTVRFNMNSRAEVQISVFEVNGNSIERIVSIDRSANRISWTGMLDQSADYYVGVSSRSGSTNYTITLEEANVTLTRQPEQADSETVTDDDSSESLDIAEHQVATKPVLPVTRLNIGQGTLDSDQNIGPSMTRHEFKSLAAAEHKVTLLWNGDADIRFRVFRRDGSPVDNQVNGRSPSSWIGNLDANQTYYVSIWSRSGAANYSAIIEASAPVSIDSQPRDITVTAGENAEFKVQASGSGLLSYQWFANNNALNGETAESLLVSATKLYEDGTSISVEVSNGVNTVKSRTASLSVNPPMFSRPASSSITANALFTWSAAGDVHRVITVGNILYVAGDFDHIYSQHGDVLTRNHLAAFNRYTGEPLDFAPVIDGDVRALALSPDEKTLYVGGSFKKIDGNRRSRAAAFNIGNGGLKHFNPPKLNRPVHAIAVTDHHVYLGGLFTIVDNSPKSYLAAFNPETGALDSEFAASPNYYVNALVAGPEGLWLGGDFHRINRHPQRGIGLVNQYSGAYIKTDAVGADVVDLAASKSQLFVALGARGGRAAAFDRASGTEQWTIKSAGIFLGVAVDAGRYVYFGGRHEAVEGNSAADRLTRHEKLTGKMDTSWLPSINGSKSVNTIAVEQDGLYIGGNFTRVSTKPQGGFAIFSGLTE